MTNKPCKDCGKQNPSDIHTCTPMTKKEPKQLTILEQIKKAWAMGWSATLRPLAKFIDPHTEKSHVIICEEDKIMIEYIGGMTELLNIEKAEQFEITGYKYGAELCGQEEIPYEQEFKIKDSGRKFIWGEWNESNSPISRIDKSEIAPYFE